MKNSIVSNQNLCRFSGEVYAWAKKFVGLGSGQIKV